ncbi:MAG: methyltransferase domain-containing protein, partial [Negativicutes bacterium]|nr:methyltransferase domain-containing protein [Negativicutes bacterium]
MGTAKNTERLDSLPGCGYKIWQCSKEFCFTTDAVFLASFPYLVKRARVLELGAGTGAISLLLAARGAAQVTGIDCNRHVVELMQRSIEENKLEACVHAVF